MKAKYIIKRLLIAIPTFFGITILAYMISCMAPGSPLDMLLADPHMTAEEIARKEVELGLDKPYIIQYFTWLENFLHGKLGFSYRTGREVLTMIQERLGPTLLLTCAALLFSILIAVPLGILAAKKPYSVWDYTASGISFFTAATPNFFVGLIFIYLFVVKMKILPMGGMYDTTGTPTYAMLARHMIMPTIVLAFQQMGSWIRFTRSSMLEVLNEDYIRTAKSKGLHWNAVVYKHGLRNALIPVVTEIGMSIPSLVGGAVVTEQIFNWPGIGSLMVQSISARDYPVIMGVTVIVAGVVLIGNILVDLTYGLLDPRISYK